MRVFSAMFARIFSDPAILAGKPCIKGTRISVELILEWIASGATAEQITQAYPQLTAEDVSEAVSYAARFLENEVVISTEVGA